MAEKKKDDKASAGYVLKPEKEVRYAIAPDPVRQELDRKWAAELKRQKKTTRKRVSGK